MCWQWQNWQEGSGEYCIPNINGRVAQRTSEQVRRGGYDLPLEFRRAECGKQYIVWKRRGKGSPTSRFESWRQHIKGNIGNIITGKVEALHCFKKNFNLFLRRQKFYLQYCLHSEDHNHYLSGCQPNSFKKRSWQFLRQINQENSLPEKL